MSHISHTSTRGGDTNSGGMETRVAAPPRIAAGSTRGNDTNNGGFENRVTAAET